MNWKEFFNKIPENNSIIEYEKENRELSNQKQNLEKQLIEIRTKWNNNHSILITLNQIADKENLVIVKSIILSDFIDGWFKDHVNNWIFVHNYSEITAKEDTIIQHLSIIVNKFSISRNQVVFNRNVDLEIDNLQTLQRIFEFYEKIPFEEVPESIISLNVLCQNLIINV